MDDSMDVDSSNDAHPSRIDNLQPNNHANSGNEERERRIRIQNRRRRYLDLYPEYFDAWHHELADPLLYERLVRRFQTSPSESEHTGNHQPTTRPNPNLPGPAKSSSQHQQPPPSSADLLEAQLLRSEAKLSALRAPPDPLAPITYVRTGDGGSSITAIEKDASERAVDAEDGKRRWKEFLTERFFRGEDSEFEYEGVDSNEDLDDWEEEGRERLEAWLDEEEAVFLLGGDEHGGAGAGPVGETGVQDF